ncbi:MAG TPA: ribose-5-phosphate isomerase RpiA [Puia sp.]|nr:ribose-5-phosphate isomerase RpiA [Puia sp.]
MNAKQVAATKAISFIQNGMTVGLGTGTTAYWAIEGIGHRIHAEGLEIKAIATSKRTEAQALSFGIPVLSFAEINQIDITIDGADEADDDLNLIKGGGGALLREKIVASNSKELIIIVDDSKLVHYLGKFPLPVEVFVFGWEKTIQKLQDLGCTASLRMENNQAYVTDNNNYIIDCSFGEIQDPVSMHDRINSITGVADNGLFVRMVSKLIVGDENGNTRIFKK